MLGKHQLTHPNGRRTIKRFNAQLSEKISQKDKRRWWEMERGWIQGWVSYIGNDDDTADASTTVAQPKRYTRIPEERQQSAELVETVEHLGELMSISDAYFKRGVRDLAEPSHMDVMTTYQFLLMRFESQNKRSEERQNQANTRQEQENSRNFGCAAPSAVPDGIDMQQLEVNSSGSRVRTSKF